MNEIDRCVQTISPIKAPVPMPKLNIPEKIDIATEVWAAGVSVMISDCIATLNAVAGNHQSHVHHSAEALSSPAILGIMVTSAGSQSTESSLSAESHLAASCSSLNSPCPRWVANTLPSLKYDSCHNFYFLHLLIHCMKLSTTKLILTSHFFLASSKTLGERWQ